MLRQIGSRWRWLAVELDAERADFEPFREKEHCHDLSAVRQQPGTQVVVDGGGARECDASMHPTSGHRSCWPRWPVANFGPAREVKEKCKIAIHSS